MDPVMRFVLAVVGAIAGINFGGAGAHFFDALLGAFAGFAVADLSHIRARLRTLEEEFARNNGGHPVANEFAADQPDLEDPPDREHHAENPPPSPSNPPSPLVSPGRPTVAPKSVLAAAQSSFSAFAPLEPDLSPPQAPYREPPNFILEGIRRFLGGGNLLVRLGVIVLFFGIAFLLRYVAEHTRVPIEYRLSGVALGGVALLGLGWRLRSSRPGFALSIQGCGVGILYLTVFAAFHLYALVPPVLAFALLTSIATLSALLAVMQNSQALALLGVTGGFLAPDLASSGNGDHVFLFGYYAVLNAGILLVAWFKSWRGLNLAGFAFTFGVGTVWGALSYRPQDFASTEPFLILFFLFYLGIGVLFTWRQPPRLRSAVDGTLIFGTPLAAFGLQALMLHARPFALAYSALAIGALYLGIAALLQRRRDDTQRLLIEAFVALAVVFLTLAAPLALGSRWNACAWALEGGALVWIGCRQDRLLSRLFGVLLLIAAGFLLAKQFGFASPFLTLPWNAYLAVLLVSGASIAAAASIFVFARSSRQAETLLANAMFCWGALWWALGGLAELSQFVPVEYFVTTALTFLSLTTLAVSVFHRRLPMPAAVALTLAQFPVILIFALGAAIAQSHPFDRGGWVAWPMAFACLYLVLYRHESALARPVDGAVHVVSAWLLIALSSWEAEWMVNFLVRGSHSWPAVAWAIVPAAALAALVLGLRRMPWPLARHPAAFVIVAVGLAFALSTWSLINNLSMTGDVAPLPYVPLLNPVDVVQLFVFLVLWRCWRVFRVLPAVIKAGGDPRAPALALAVLGFVWLNASLLRTLHQWAEVPWSLSGMLESTLTQTALSIFWASLAFASMLFAIRKSDRSIWFAGAALLAIVTAKLFFVDLSSVGSIERIVSFVGVGVLMLVIGYYCPLPPRRVQNP